ncbi:MAG TPA: TetR/AcrR family transcriptional regulator [Candidatus Eisenbacteria bacterium]|nr:TetR/AcrR family transcriptional regulator [Candidatus Eisenbacteria bacterium]
MAKNRKKILQAQIPSQSGRTAQRNRTRKAIVDATMQLMAAGRTPSITEIIQAAQVSRRTIYMYFPTMEQLLLDATLGALSAKTIDPAITDFATNDVAARVEHLSRTANSSVSETIHLGRALIRLTVEGEEPLSGGPRRGYRRIQWIERALDPARAKLRPKEFERLVSALSLLIGWEPLIVLKDVRGLDQKEAVEVLAFAARAIVNAALHPHS